jgi:hypothetical protein
MKELDHYGNCPVCGKSWNGGLIADAFKEARAKGDAYWRDKTDEEIDKTVKESYGEPYSWSRLIGVQVWGGYDGISFWQCPDCKTEWDRFTGKKVKKKKKNEA